MNGNGPHSSTHLEATDSQSPSKQSKESEPTLFCRIGNAHAIKHSTHFLGQQAERLVTQIWQVANSLPVECRGPRIHIVRFHPLSKNIENRSRRPIFRLLTFNLLDQRLAPDVIFSGGDVETILKYVSDPTGVVRFPRASKAARRS